MKLGFETIPGWEQLFIHRKLNLTLFVYVDDFKLAGPKQNIQKGWDLIKKAIDLDEPTDFGKYLGCVHTLKEFPSALIHPKLEHILKIIGCEEQTARCKWKSNLRGVEYSAPGYMQQCTERYLSLAGLQEKDLKRADTPGCDDAAFAPSDWTDKGKLSSDAAQGCHEDPLRSQILSLGSVTNSKLSGTTNHKVEQSLR